MTFLLSQIESWKADLAALPPPDPTTRKVGKLAAVAMMATQLQALKRQGYTTAELVDFLRDRGLTIHRDTLRRALKRPRKAAATGGRRRRDAGKTADETGVQAKDGGVEDGAPTEMPADVEPFSVGETDDRLDPLANLPRVDGRTSDRRTPRSTGGSGSGQAAAPPSSPSAEANDRADVRPPDQKARAGPGIDGIRAPGPRATFAPRSDSDDI